jgi:S-adenosylmethionine hydrolase
VAPGSLGEEIDPSSLTDAPFGPCSVDGAYVTGEVLEFDRFGSLRFNIPEEELGRLGLTTAQLEISLGHNALTVPFAKTFSDVAEGEPVALIDSSGWLTLAVNTGHAAHRYGIEPGTHVRVRPVP